VPSALESIQRLPAAVSNHGHATKVIDTADMIPMTVRGYDCNDITGMDAAKEALDDIGDFLRQQLLGEADNTITNKNPQTYKLEKAAL
jgi:hypothetical protein